MYIKIVYKFITVFSKLRNKSVTVSTNLICLKQV